MKKKSYIALTAVTFALSMISLASCGDTSIATNIAEHAENSEICTVTFIYGNASVKTKNVFSGDCIEDPGEDTTVDIISEYLWSGWYLGDEVYDFSTPVTEDITLRSVCRSFKDIDCTLQIETFDSYKMSHGEIIRGAKYSEYHGTWMETVSLNEIFSGTTIKDFSSYDLLDEDGNVISTLSGNDTITFDHEYMTIKPVATTKTVSITWNLDEADGTLSDEDAALFEDMEHDVSQDLVMPDIDFGETDNGYYFIGWRLSALMASSNTWRSDPTQEIYRPGEVIPSSVVEGFGDEVKFNAYFIETDYVYHISTFDELFVDYDYDNCTDSAIVLDNDIDGDGGDTGCGIGDGEYNGIILGNGHTLKNFTINLYEDQTCAGLIDTTYDGCSIFDLTVENASYYDCAMYGAGVLIGEIDSYSSIKNVTIKDCSIGGLSTYGRYGVDYVAGAVGTVYDGGVSMSNVTVDNFDASCAIEYADDFRDAARNITVGGLIGYETCNSYPDKIVNCSVLNSNLTRSGHTTVTIGGLTGQVDVDNATIYDGNTVSNTTLGISDAYSRTLSSADNNIRGTLGSNYAGSYRRTLQYYYSSGTRNWAKGVPTYISNNTIDVTTYINTLESDTSSVSFAGITPELDNYKNGKGSTTNTIFTAITENDINISFTSDLQGTNNVFGGGISGTIGQDSSDYNNIIVDHNEINVDFDAVGTGTYSRIAGAVGIADTVGTSGMIFDSNVVYGSISALPSDTSGIKCILAGFVGDSETADADFVYDHIYMDVDITADSSSSTYGNVFSTLNTSSYSDENGAIYLGDDIYVNSDNARGTLCRDYYSRVSDDNATVENMGFSSYYWEDGEDGRIHLK